MPVDQVSIWPAVKAQVNDLTAFDLAEELEILKIAGQRMPVVVRRLPDGRFEAIGRAHLVRVVEEHNSLNPASPVDLAIHVMNLNDDDAFRFAAQELDPGAPVSSYARGCFFVEARKHHGTEQDVARMCRVSKATISKNLDVHRAVDLLGDKIEVRRDVSQRDAMWLMSVVGRTPKGGDAPDQEQRHKVLAALQQVKPGPARKVFAELRKATKGDRPAKAIAAITHDGREIGTMRRSWKGGPVTFRLADTGDIELDQVTEAVREALARALRS